MHQRFTSFFPQLSADIQAAALPIFNREQFNGILAPADIQALKAQTGLDDDALAIGLLPAAAAYSVAPISQFHVGAIARGVSGNWYLGANVEFAGVPLGQSIHAEQCAIVHAWSCGETRLDTITVNYSPCGHCRQFMTELNSQRELKISLPGRDVLTLGDYLVDSFGPADLGIHTLLLDPQDHGYSIQGNNHPLADAALEAANRSHAPYSLSHSAVAILTDKGEVYAGAYAENAAFNPSLPPLQAAVLMMYLKGSPDDRILRAVVAEETAPQISQYASTLETLRTLGCEDVQKLVITRRINP
ncbi:cytidine deaminase [Duganella sp. sic0402]|uniref:cytidine deaminase n=1 Tax=Duganella sp. sic0402 TaxID=2854786 RepID=UPI001C4788A6|nr:cytidine deaminase [Duganella sp. sic0402]MBV7536823.1 cytidine deaminase [Duganella sp. sic0402]